MSKRFRETIALVRYAGVLMVAGLVAGCVTPQAGDGNNTPQLAVLTPAVEPEPSKREVKPEPVAKSEPVAKTKPAAPSTQPIVKVTTSRAGRTPDVLVLGDSQISVSAGPAYQKFFTNFQSVCKASAAQLPAVAKINFTKTASLGVRSTSLHSWTARSGAAKGSICDVDKKFGVNAGVWGIAGNPNRKYVQIGKGRDYQFCKPNRSAFETMFANGYYRPKLLVMAFLGNSAERWANSKQSAVKDVRATLAQIPSNTPCVFMTSVPVYSKKVNDIRMRAQTNIIAAFKASGNRCSVVKGFTPQVRGQIEGNSTYFRKNKSGRIADKFHPNAGAVQKFISFNTPALCAAVRQQLGG